MIYIPTVNMSHEDWLRYRQSGIGGSDSPALLLPPDVYKWKRPKDVLASKIGEIDEKESLSCRFGHYNEPFVAALFSEATGMQVRSCNMIMRSEKHPFMLANIDRKLVGRRAGLEIKTTSQFRDRLFTAEEYPYEYYVQMQHYMAVTGWREWYLAALIGNSRFVWYRVPRNDDDIKNIINTEKQFWDMKSRGVTVKEIEELWA